MLDNLTVLDEANMSLDVNISEPEEFNCNELHNAIKEVATKIGINDFEYHVESLCGKGDNYIANLFRVVIKDTNEETNSASVIVKTLVNTARQETFHELHKREVEVYEKVIPMFLKIQQVLNEENKVMFPNCVLSRINDGQEILILEDMNLKGFSMSDKVARFEQLNLTEVELILKELAKFHALSLIYKNQEPESFKNLKHEFQDLMFDTKFLNKSQLRKYFDESFEMSLKVVDDFETNKLLRKIGTKLTEILRFYTKPNKRCNVFCHGDCWVNNILFKKSETEHQLCFLDFQALRYTNPATDIVHFLFLCTNSNFRFQHFENLLDIYYESLQTFLNLFNLDINNVYSRGHFDLDVKDMLPFGLLIALIELRIVTCTSDDIDALRGSVLALNTIGLPPDNELFRVRVNDVVREAKRNGAISKLVDEVYTSIF
ncbi:hypothetical protein MSG28_012850 [Choristoneura fumiferana]|uniref:Uncharacterized protein n=1 Tax=Choristoneura fumiferana TaxID=7141 RepID=A0ACC0JI92_CHOFU|nr:hypothetical protein MSG28_012850 [Choristoneura fumiferana]